MCDLVKFALILDIQELRAVSKQLFNISASLSTGLCAIVDAVHFFEFQDAFKLDFTHHFEVAFISNQKDYYIR